MTTATKRPKETKGSSTALKTVTVNGYYGPTVCVEFEGRLISID